MPRGQYKRKPKVQEEPEPEPVRSVTIIESSEPGIGLNHITFQQVEKMARDENRTMENMICSLVIRGMGSEDV